MPEQSVTMHFRFPDKPLGPSACGAPGGWRTGEPGEVTCFSCRRTPVFLDTQRNVPPVRLDRVIETHPIMAGIYAEAIRRGEDTPRYLHDCSDCEFIGPAVLNHHHWDLYWCHGPEEGNVLARKGNDPAEYYSGLSTAATEPALALAAVRAIRQGLMPAKTLGLL